MIDDDLFFTIIDVRPSFFAKSKAFLVTDNWDDWFKFSTLFELIVFDSDGKKHEIGYVKIGQFGMKEDQRHPNLPTTFDGLDELFFSLGQDESYYSNLNMLGEDLCLRILNALRDIVLDPELLEKALNEEVTKTSLLRSVSLRSVRGQFRRLALGEARLTEYSFSYRAPRRVGTAHPPIEVSFEVKPESNPPTNIHVLIGRNGMGKTYLLNLMTRALVDKEPTAKKFGRFISEDKEEDIGIFANLISVTFSAFDPFDPLPEQRDETVGIKYSYIGLKSLGSEMNSTPKTLKMLTNEFVKSVYFCLHKGRGSRWRKALEMLEADPIFKEADVTALADSIEADDFKRSASTIFENLSSGHKIVLLTITRLVETVEERTLVLLDEPEAHLHPPLLSAFIRTLSDLLIKTNGVAIVATHSPVILQEVPKSCVCKLRRSGSVATAERPEIETFGENLSTLTREIFGFEVTQSGFHRLLKEEVNRDVDYNSVIGHFNDEVGAEARAIISALIAERDGKDWG